MSHNKRSLIGRRELQSLVASRDSFLGDRAAEEEVGMNSADITHMPSPRAPHNFTFSYHHPNVGHSSLPSPNYTLALIRPPHLRDNDNSFKKRQVKGKEATGTAVEARQENLVPNHGHRTREAGRLKVLYLHQQKLKNFNVRFRALPAEVREIIFGFAIDGDDEKTPELIIALRSSRNHPNYQLYREAQRAFCIHNTFLLSRTNIRVLYRNEKDYMSPEVWESIRNLKIKHLYPHPYAASYYSNHSNNPESQIPSTRCTLNTIVLAANVRKLHLDFGNWYPCILMSVAVVCRLAGTKMQHLKRLELTLSHAPCMHSESLWPWFFDKLNICFGETGRLLSVCTIASLFSPIWRSFEPESWFWQASEPNRTLTWIDNLTLRYAKARCEAAATVAAAGPVLSDFNFAESVWAYQNSQRGGAASI